MITSHVRGAAILVSASVALLAACESENNGPTQHQSGELTIDASSNTAFQYFSFAADTVVSVANPQNSTEWDLAFRRFEVKLNGGVAGTKGVTGYNLANNAGATEAQVLAFTADNQKPAFDAVDESKIPADDQFTSEGLAPDVTGWFQPTPTGLVANPTRAWKFKLPSGRGYAALRVERIDNDANPSPTDGMSGIRLGFRLEAGGALGAVDSVIAALPSGASAVINLTTKQVTIGAPPADCSWDVRVSRAYEFEINDGATCGAGTFPLAGTESFTDLTTASDAPQYAPYISLVSGPIPNSFDDPKGPFLYGLNGTQLLYPTFNIYLVKVGSAVYKLQLTNYYGTSGASAGQSGHPTIRYARIR